MRLYSFAGFDRSGGVNSVAGWGIIRSHRKLPSQCGRRQLEFLNTYISG